MTLKIIFFTFTYNLMKKTLSLFITVLSITTILSGCGKKGGEPGGNQYGLSTKNNVVYWLLSDVEKLIPYVAHDASAPYVNQQIWEALNGINQRTQDLMPLLASLPEISADHLVYTYTINPAAKFSDGVPLTGEDVIFSFKTAMDPLLFDATALGNYLYPVDSVGYVGGDKMKVAFYLNKAYFQMDRVLGGGYVLILPKHIFDKGGLTDKYSWNDIKQKSASAKGPMQALANFIDSNGLDRDPKMIIGSGPYLFKQWLTNDRITLEKNKNYWGKDLPWGTVYPDEAIFKTILDPNAALTALKAKDIDFMERVIPPASWVTLNSPYIKKDTEYFNTYSYIAWNNERDIFKDKKVRLALGHLINRDEIIVSVLKGIAHKVEGPVIFTQPNYTPSSKVLDYNVDEAKRLLTEAGWMPGEGGVLYKNINGKNTPFKFTFKVNNSNETRKQILLIISEQLRKVGIQAEVQPQDWSVFLNDLHSHNFDASYSALSGNASEDDLYQTWHSSQSKNRGSNVYSFINADADRLMEQNRVEFDPAKR
jgi:peptide/nickel transport system substrate-binding protein